ncbi:hypothetical protein HNR12_004320 [Streptomonospora nanhaiensis]|uniref:Uncharacterized protein n=1 Tax=Streptomonospora nanhaiensis TaxID=1323731 RepID=A0A853BSB9_9ACTN|nr:DUF6114 domain-containing protein [Streptomonospora nanhaiensis]NYI98043.1 hypothetical protein [Streptomonospora nanhaiensis]
MAGNGSHGTDRPFGARAARGVRGTPRRASARRSAFRRWRGSRPFWGGLLTVLAGAVVIAAPALNPLELIVQQGIAGISGYFAGVLLMAIGVLVWLQPPQRFFYGIVAILLALVSFVTSNFGGFVFGMLFGLVGGALTIAWVPDRPARRKAARRAAAREEPEVGTERATGEAPGPADEEAPGAAPEAPRKAEADARGEEPPPTRFEPRGESPTTRIDTRGAAPVEPRAAEPPGSLHALSAAVLALALAVPGPAAITWPWDDWFGGGGGETSEPSPSPSPSESGAAPSDPPGGGDEGGAGGGAEEGSGDGGTAEDGADGADADEDAQREEERDRPEPAAECTVQEGAAAMPEEEYRALLEACRRAQESGEPPEVQVSRGDEAPWPAHTAESGLSADRLHMEGASFDGVVEYPSRNGTVRYLKLSMDVAEFTGARQWFAFDGGDGALEIPEMTMSGEVVMHVTRMKASILGIPLTFTPDFPPPLLLPTMTVTDLEVDQPLAQAQEISIGDLSETIEA